MNQKVKGSHTGRRGFLVVVMVFFSLFARAEFTEVVSSMTPSVVAVGLYTPLEREGNQVLGTGFVVGDGTWAITNYHVVSKILDPEIVQHYVVISGYGTDVRTFKANIVDIDPLHDLALLKFEGKIPPVSMAQNEL